MLTLRNSGRLLARSPLANDTRLSIAGVGARRWSWSFWKVDEQMPATSSQWSIPTWQQLAQIAHFTLKVIVELQAGKRPREFYLFNRNLCLWKIETHLDSKPYLLGAQNGVVDLRAGELRGRTPNYMVFCLANLVYDFEIDTSMVQWYSDEHYGRRAGNMVSFLQRFLGYCITGEVQEVDFTFCTNSGMPFCCPQ